MSKLYVAMVGLPARGKSTLAKRIMSGLNELKIQAEIFNNGELRRMVYGMQSAAPEFFNPQNAVNLDMRKQLATQNMARAKAWLEQPGHDVAIIDATNGTQQQRNVLTQILNDHPILFVECVNADALVLDVSIKRKTTLAEFAQMSEEDALRSFKARMAFYESVYQPVGQEKCWIRVDAMDNNILAEAPSNDLPYYTAIRDIVSSRWVRKLFLVRHGETEFNLEGRIGGDPPLTPKGRLQAITMAEYFKDKDLPYVFTSTKWRSTQTAEQLLHDHPKAINLVLPEFDEIDAGECEGMTYSEIQEQKPFEYASRARNKYGYIYPGGESYALLKERVARGIRRAFFLAGEETLLIVGHQAINRTILSLFLFQRPEDVPYTYIPQNQFYQITITQRKKLFEMISYT